MPTIQLPIRDAATPSSVGASTGRAYIRRSYSGQNPLAFFEMLVFPYQQAGVASMIPRAHWQLRLPDDYASGGTLKILWAALATAGNVHWQARVAAITPGDADTPWQHAFAAAATVTTAVNATEQRRLTESQITLTMDGAAAGDLILLQLYRDPVDAADTATVDCDVLSVALVYA